MAFSRELDLNGSLKFASRKSCPLLLWYSISAPIYAHSRACKPFSRLQIAPFTRIFDFWIGSLWSVLFLAKNANWSVIVRLKFEAAKKGGKENRLLGGDEALVDDVIVGAAPLDFALEEARYPDNEGESVAQRHEIEFLAQQRILHAPHADRPGHQRAQDDVAGGVENRDGPRRRDGHGKNRPRQALRENQRKMSPRLRVLHRQIPAHLMAEALRE